jgi:hypothetical protein
MRVFSSACKTPPDSSEQARLRAADERTLRARLRYPRLDLHVRIGRDTSKWGSRGIRQPAVSSAVPGKKRAAFRYLLTRTRYEEPHRNAKNAYLCATRFKLCHYPGGELTSQALGCTFPARLKLRMEIQA